MATKQEVIEQLEAKISERVGFTFSSEEKYIYPLMKLLATLHKPCVFTSVELVRVQICSKIWQVIKMPPCAIYDELMSALTEIFVEQPTT